MFTTNFALLKRSVPQQCSFFAPVCWLKRAPAVRKQREYKRATVKRGELVPSMLRMHLSNQWDRVLGWGGHSGLTSWCLAQEGAEPADSTLFVRIIFGGVAIVFFGILFTTITGRMVSKVDEDPSARALLGDILDVPRERRATGKRRKPPSEATAPDPDRKLE